MKNALLLLALAAGTTSISAAELGELPTNRQLTVNKGDSYTFTPNADGVLSIAFEGSYPNEGIVWSNIYNEGTNPEMVMQHYYPFSEVTWMGPVSPAKFEIKVYQPLPDSTEKVKYMVVGPDDADSIVITATFDEAGSVDAVELASLSQTPGGVFNFNESGTLAFTFNPFVPDLKCNGIEIDMYAGDLLAKTITGASREITFDYSSGLGYFMNLTNLWDYELKDTDIDSFTIKMSGFNYNIAGDYADENGNLTLHYLVDEFYGMITVEGEIEWPAYIYPGGADPSTAVITYSAPLDSSAGGDVQILGTDLAEINSEPSAKTNVYQPEVAVNGNTVTIDFNNFRQTGPVDDGGNIVRTDGYRTSGQIMSVIVRNLLGADGSQVQPILAKIKWQESSGVHLVSVSPISADGNIYSLDGIPVKVTEAGIDTLPAGLYIINGKKVWKK